MDHRHPEDRDDLLTPVLGTEKMSVPAYSTRAQFLTAFFGGPFAIILFSGLNAIHMGRLQKDAWRYALATIASIAVVAWVVSVFQGASPPVWTTELFGDDAQRAVNWAARGFGLLVWLVLWLPYRRYHRAAEIMGIKPRPPWIAVAACIAAAFALQFIVVSTIDIM